MFVVCSLLFKYQFFEWKFCHERNFHLFSCLPMPCVYIACSQAFETKSTLMSQRASLQGSATGITGLVANVPSFQRLIEGVQRKKTRETMLVSLFVGVLLCFTIWYAITITTSICIFYIQDILRKRDILFYRWICLR